MISVSGVRIRAAFRPSQHEGALLGVDAAKGFLDAGFVDPGRALLKGSTRRRAEETRALPIGWPGS